MDIALPGLDQGKTRDQEHRGRRIKDRVDMRQNIRERELAHGPMTAVLIMKLTYMNSDMAPSMSANRISFFRFLGGSGAWGAWPVFKSQSSRV